MMFEIFGDGRDVFESPGQCKCYFKWEQHFNIASVDPLDLLIRVVWLECYCVIVELPKLSDFIRDTLVSVNLRTLSLL